MLIPIRTVSLVLATWLALLSSLVAAGQPVSASATPNAGELVVLTWSDYIDPAVVSEFEQAHEVRVRFAYFETDDHRSEILAMSDGHGYDVIVANGLTLETYVKRGWLAPVDATHMANLRHLDPRWRDAFPGARDHAVAYFWGTLGIGYRKDLLPEPLTTWERFFRPDDTLASRIGMPEASRDVVSMALKALGYSANTHEFSEVRAAEDLLYKQLPFVRTYAYPALTADSALVRGEIWAAMMYNGDALLLAEHDENIGFVLPEEGGNIWVDYLAIAATARHPSLAARFIDYLNEPSVAARNAQWVHYATPNRAAVAHLPANHLNDAAIYPDAADLARSEFYRPVPPKLNRRIKTIMVDLVRRHSQIDQ